jgi:molybdate transport system substrate-binding protein
MLANGVVRSALGLAILLGPAGKRVEAQQITVFAAASLTNAFTDIGAEIHRKNPGLEIRFNFAASQQLVFQLEQGARADVFSSADERWMTYAVEHSLVDGPPQVFAYNHLVVIVPKTNPARIARLADLARTGTKLVLAADVVPAGRYSRDILLNLSRLPAYGANFSTRVLANVVSNEETVKGVVSKVQLGEADAGIVYRTDVTQDLLRFVTMLPIPDAQNVLATYPVGTVKNSLEPGQAKAFIAYLLSEEGQRTLARHGFIGSSGRP